MFVVIRDYGKKHARVVPPCHKQLPNAERSKTVCQRIFGAHSFSVHRRSEVIDRRRESHAEPNPLLAHIKGEGI